MSIRHVDGGCQLAPWKLRWRVNCYAWTHFRFRPGGNACFSHGQCFTSHKLAHICIHTHTHRHTHTHTRTHVWIIKAEFRLDWSAVHFDSFRPRSARRVSVWLRLLELPVQARVRVRFVFSCATWRIKAKLRYPLGKRHKGSLLKY